MNRPFQPLMNKLEADLEALLTELESYPPSVLTARPAPEAWSVLEIMQHLMVSETRSLEYIEKKSGYPEALKNAGLMTSLRAAVLKMFLWMPFKYKAPGIVNEDHFRENVSLKELSGEWRAIRGELTHFLENMNANWYEKELYRHAVAGRMTIRGMLTFFSEHFTRHRKQIKRTLEIVSS